MRIDSAIITGSFSVNGDTFNDLGSYSTTGSNTFVGNQSIVGAVSASALTGSINYTNLTGVPTLVSGSEQIVGILSPLNSYTQSNDTTNTTQNTRLSNLENKTGSLATTGSNIFIGNQTISGTVYIQNDLVVQGCSSLQNITASAVSIGTNIVQLNTDTPSVRFAGLTVQDSGSSAGVTGSMLWDSLCNRWIYSNPSTIGYSGGMLLSGPRAATLGTETTLTCNYIAKSGGGDHLYDSAIYESEGNVGIGIVPSYPLHVSRCSVYHITAEQASTDTNDANAYATFFLINNAGTSQVKGYFGAGGNSVSNGGMQNHVYVGSQTNHGLKFFTNDTARVTINNCGEALFSKLVTGQASIYQSDAGGLIASNRWGVYNGGSTAMSFLYNASGNVVWNNGSDRMTLTNTGNLGINDTTPTAKLQINCTNTWGDQTNESINIVNSGANGNINTQHNMGAITWYSGNVKTAAITAWRNTPGSGNYVDLGFATATAGTQVERMRIMSYGSVGIHTASPNTSSPLHVKMCSNSNGDGIRVQAMCSGGAGSQPGIAFANTSDCKRWNIAMDTSTDTFQITNAGGSNVFNVTQSCVVCTGPVTIVGMQGGGDTTVIAGGSGYGSSIRMNYASGPYNNYLAGNGDNFFNCVTGKLNAQGGIKFGGGSGTLNHYESGTWTPQLYWSNGGQYCMGGINGGNYVRIGNVVHVNYHLQWSALCGSSGFSGQLRIGGLPFVVGGYRSAGTISAINSGIGRSGTNITWHALTADPGANFIYWIENDAAGGYGHSPSVGAGGLVYSNQLTYTLH